MELRFKPYTLELKHPFSLGNGSIRTSTSIMLVEIEHKGHIGLGEASMPPYLGESFESAQKFYVQINLSNFSTDFSIEKIMGYVDGILPNNTAAKASVDIALHDLWGKMENKALYQLLGSDLAKLSESACTIGIDSPEVLKIKVGEAKEFKNLKIKLGSKDDKEIIQCIRSVSQKPLYVDVNQGWSNKEEAIQMIEWLAKQNVKFIEQPLNKLNLEDHYWLKQRSSIPIFADESCQRLSDIDSVKDCFDGINIKLMKCTGIYEAQKMLKRTKELNLKTMIGCMTESSCATMAAVALSAQFDYIDLDGPWLVKNNPFENPIFSEGKIIPNDLAGLGLKTVSN